MMKKQTPQFYILGFVLALFLGWPFTKLFYKGADIHQQEKVELRKKWLEEHQLREFGKPEISNPKKTKAMQYFYMTPVGGGQEYKIAIDVLSSPQIFNSLFPGYPDKMRMDEQLWGTYFTREFDIKVMSGFVSEKTNFGALFFMASAGCIDIYKKYGADIIYFGSSDVGQGIAADLIQEELRHLYPKQNYNLKILNCSAPAQSPQIVLKTLKQLHEVNPQEKPKMIIYPINRIMALGDSIYIHQATESKQAALDHYRATEGLGEYFEYDHPITFPLDWNDLILLPRTRLHLALSKQNERKDKTLTNRQVDRWSELPVKLSKLEVENAENLYKIASSTSFNNFLFEGETSCNNTYQIEQKVFQAIHLMQSLSSHVVVFEMPTLNALYKNAPSCFENTFDQFKLNLSILGVFDQDSLQTIHADNFDFLYNDLTSPETFRIDVIHGNKFLAQKISKYLAQQIDKSMRNSN